MNPITQVIPPDLKDNIYLNEFARQRSLESAYRLLLKLRELKLNIVTAESLTAGLIAKTLVDIPTFGPNIYGGIIVYDSDAKRKFLNVGTANVYSDETAKQMAEGALLNSRAMVSIAVTGNAGPVRLPDIETLGVVDIGVSVRLHSSTNANKWSTCTETTRINTCKDEKHYTHLCALYRKELELDFGNCKPINKSNPFTCSSLGSLSLIRNIIRTHTVASACSFALDVLIRLQNNNRLPIADEVSNLMQVENWDGKYIGCDEPSYIIERYLDKENMKKVVDGISKKNLLFPAKTFSN